MCVYAKKFSVSSSSSSLVFFFISRSGSMELKRYALSRDFIRLTSIYRAANTKMPTHTAKNTRDTDTSEYSSSVLEIPAAAPLAPRERVYIDGNCPSGMHTVLLQMFVTQSLCVRHPMPISHRCQQNEPPQSTSVSPTSRIKLKQSIVLCASAALC